MTLSDHFNTQLSLYFSGHGDNNLQKKIQYAFKLLKLFHSMDYFALNSESLHEYISGQPYLHTVPKDFCHLLIDWLYDPVNVSGPVNRVYHARNHYTKILYSHPSVDNLSSNATVSEVYELTYQLYIRHQRKKTIINCNEIRMLMEPSANKIFRLMRPADLSRLTAKEAPSSFGQMLALLKKMEQCAYACDIINTFHFKDYPAVHSYNPRAHIYIGDDDIQCLLRHKGLFPVDLTLLFLYSGLTTTEATLLLPDWINLNRGEIITKHQGINIKNRIIPIHQNLYPVLQDWMHIPENQFFRAVEGKRLRDYDLTQMVKFTGLAYMGKLITPGDCRHYFQSLLESTGATPTQIAVLLGNAPIGTGPCIYTHPTPTTLHAIIDRIA